MLQKVDACLTRDIIDECEKIYVTSLENDMRQAPWKGVNVAKCSFCLVNYQR